LISELSRGLTLVAGTVILTGTPSGVGMARTPPVWLKDGDEVEVMVEKVGAVRNRVRFEA
jgi:2,4-didehydro-3-deoxy-L-rhamnonate hydrolase